MIWQMNKQERPLFSIFETLVETIHKLTVSVLWKAENMTPPPLEQTHHKTCIVHYMSVGFRT